MTLVPLDATNRVPVTTSVGEALARYHYASTAATLASEVVAATGMSRGGQYFWDPLAAVTALRPGLVATTTKRVDVVTTGSDAGRTVVAGDAPQVQVVALVDRARFERELLGTLLDGAPFRVPASRPAATLTLDAAGCTYRGADALTAGDVVLDTVNRTATTLQFAAGRLTADHTVSDLRRLARNVSATTTVPRWFTVDASGEVPPRSEMTWGANLPTGTTGETVLLCATPAPPRAWVAATIPVFARR